MQAGRLWPVAGFLFLFLLNLGIEADVDTAVHAHRRRTLLHVGVERSLRAVTRPGGDLQVVPHANAHNADDAIDVLDVTLDFTPDLVRVIRNLTCCQGP